MNALSLVVTADGAMGRQTGQNRMHRLTSNTANSGQLILSVQKHMGTVRCTMNLADLTHIKLLCF